jgi:hypothetical protein
MNIRNLTSLQQFVEKIPLYDRRHSGKGVAGLLNQYPGMTQTDFYHLN